MRQNASGLVLSRRFWQEAVQPILHERWPDLACSAALLGPGSEVLGFDDEMSRDHHWGPRIVLFLRAVDRGSLDAEIRQHLADTLPRTFLGYPTNFSQPDPTNNGVQLLVETQSGPVRHRVEIVDIRSFVRGYLGLDGWQDLSTWDWLTLPEQKLRSITAGEVFHDGLSGDGDTGGLASLRAALAYYPPDVWLFQMAAGWQRISQEEHLMGRAGFVGDEVGSALIGARLVRDIMRLCFLMERTYAPYAKWFGTAFRGLDCGPALYPILQAALTAPDWEGRQTRLVSALEQLSVRHNQLGLTPPLPEHARPFFGRPFRVISAGFPAALLDAMDPAVLSATMRRSPVGGIDQVSDNTDVLEDPAFQPVLRRLYA